MRSFKDVRFDVKAIPQFKFYGGKGYQLTDSSFVRSEMQKEANRLRKMGFRIRMAEYMRAGKTVYCLYKAGNKK